MTFDEIFEEILNKLLTAIIDYKTGKITIDELANACQTLIDALKFFDDYTNL